MPKEFFAHDETRQLFKTIEDISHRSGVSRAQAFEDVLRACVAALAAETMEPAYHEAIKAHTSGERPKRGVDLFPVFLAQLVTAMERKNADVLGDLFQGAISYGENGLYLTPEPIARLMATLSVEAREPSEDGRPPVIADPCCGTGILLLEAGKECPAAELVGQDVDARCARITAINLGLRGRYGWVICGNSLSREVQFVHRIGTFFHEGPSGLRRGVIRDVPPEECPVLPELRARTNADLLTAADTANNDRMMVRPAIIEMPRWLARLEPRLAALEHDRLDTGSQPQEQPSQAPVDPLRQQTLF